jgi:hypothetical protein
VGWIHVIQKRENLAVFLGQGKGFRRVVHENSALLGYHAANSGYSYRQVAPKRRWRITTTRCVIAQQRTVLKIMNFDIQSKEENFLTDWRISNFSQKKKGICSEYVRNNGALTCCTCKDYTWKSMVGYLNYSRKELYDKCIIFHMAHAFP